jgi:hypothetical protein
MTQKLGVLQKYSISVLNFLLVTVPERSEACTVFARSEAGSWVRIPHKAWMYFYLMYVIILIHSVFVSLYKTIEHQNFETIFAEISLLFDLYYLNVV